MKLYTLVSISKLAGLEHRHTVRFEDRAEADAFAAQMEALRPNRAFWIEDADDEQRARILLKAIRRGEVETTPWEEVKAGLEIAAGALDKREETTG